MQYIKIITLFCFTVHLYMFSENFTEREENQTLKHKKHHEKNLKVNKLKVEDKAKFKKDVSMEDNLRVDRNISSDKNLFVKKKIKAHKASFCDLTIGCELILEDGVTISGNLPASSGNNNVGVGQNALDNTTTGARNTAVGNNALSADASGNNNTAVGYNALSLVNADANVGVGENALSSNISGINNIAIGTNAGSNILLSNNILIADAGAGSDANTIKIGQLGTHNTAFMQGVFGVTTVNNAIPVLVDPLGQLGTTSSSKRFKENIKDADLKRIFDLIDKINIVSFHYKSDSSKREQIGMIAEQVAEIFPEFVAYDNEGKPFSIRYDLLSVLAIGAISEIKSVLNDQDIRIERLEMLINSLMPAI